MKRKSKINAIDILAFIACVLIAGISVFMNIYNSVHTCHYCHKKIFANTYVVCDGSKYYHTECYKEEKKHETD